MICKETHLLPSYKLKLLWDEQERIPPAFDGVSLAFRPGFLSQRLPFPLGTLLLIAGGAMMDLWGQCFPIFYSIPNLEIGP